MYSTYIHATPATALPDARPSWGGGGISPQDWPEPALQDANTATDRMLSVSLQYARQTRERQLPPMGTQHPLPKEGLAATFEW